MKTKSLSLSLPSLRSDFSDLESDDYSQSQKKILGRISQDTDPRLRSLDIDSSLSSQQDLGELRDKLYELSQSSQEDISDLDSDIIDSDIVDSDIIDSDIGFGVDSDSQSKSQSKSKVKTKKSKTRRRSRLAKRNTRHKKRENTSKQLENLAKREANIYMNALNKKLAKKSKKTIYKILGDELDVLKNKTSFADLIKKIRINHLLEDIHAQYDKDNEDVKLQYPTLYDKDFNEKIYKKYEFYKNRILKRTPETIEESGKQNNEIFTLSSTQKLLKNFMSPMTPYRGLLIFHGVGVGKTCAAISIAEQFKEELMEEGKKIYVIRDREIKNQLFNIDKVKAGKSELQCTGTTYLDLVNEPKAVERCQAGDNDLCSHLETMVKKTTKRYYEFHGALSWANIVNGELARARRNVPPQYRKEREINRIRKLFSDSVMIVDEAHNIKDNSEKESHIVPPILTKVVTHAKNMRLILLSATPMFNSFSDIVPILNYLLINDKRAKIKEREIFTKEGDFTPTGRQKLIEKSRGYVSYLRGEDPLYFPLRFSSSINSTKNLLTASKWAKKDMYGKKLTKAIKYMDIIGCSMSKIQHTVYNAYLDKVNKTNAFDRINDAFSTAELQIGNIVYQELNQITKDPKECYGDRGFYNIIDKVEGKTQYRFKDDKSAEIFKMPTVEKYSAKIFEILKSIEKADGLIFIYSQYESCGILPLAFALEMAGYTKYRSKHMPLLDYRGKKPSNGLQYLVISGKDNLKKGYEEFLRKEKNMINEPVKVILGTKAASEGLNLFGVREIHIMEPWHNLNRLEQVVGRGTRKFSHATLPPEKRNLTIYYYAIMTPKNEKETIDMKIYRMAEEKDIKIANIELLLKQNAIDCNMNKEGNFYTEKIWSDSVKIVTSRGEKKQVKIHDQPYSRICHYLKNCQFKCIPELKPLKDSDVDKSSYSLRFFQNDIKEIMFLITKMYQLDIVYTLSDIYDYINQKVNFLDVNTLYKALDNLIKDVIIFKDSLGRDGKIVYQGDYYLFQPINLDYDKTIYEHRRIPLTLKTNMIDLGNYVQQMRKDRIDLMKKDQYDYDEILEKIENGVEYILTNDIRSVFKCSLKLEMNEAYSIVIDRLVYQYKNVLLKNLVKKLIKNIKLDFVEERIKPHIEHNLIYYNQVWNIDNKTIYGYKLIHNDKQIFYVFNSQLDEFEYDQGNRNKILEKQLETLSSLKPENEIVGYLKFDKKDTPPSFKIRDIQNKDDVKNIKGTNCSYKGKDDIYDYIKLLLDDKDIKVDKSHKNMMCNDIEILLRRLNVRKKNKKTWFFNAEEYMATHHDI